MPHAVVALVPAPDELALEHLAAEPRRLLVIASARRPDAACPVCRCASGRVHGRYTRRLADLPWHGLAVALEVRVRRFVREVPGCPRRIFCERLPATAAAFARRTGRLDAATFAALQAACFRRAEAVGLTARGGVVTADATGLERHHVSAHFVDRRGPLLGRRRRHWPKLTVVADVATHLIAGAVVTRGPTQDSPQFPAAMRHAARLLAPRTLLGDAGYDAEHNHRLCRALGITTSVIALNARNMERRWPLAPERRALCRRFPRELYRMRWHAESVFSRHKRRLGSALTARRPRAQRRETLLRVLTHNLMILRPTG